MAGVVLMASRKKPLIAKEVLIVPADRHDTDIGDSLEKAMTIKASAIRLGAVLEKKKYIIRDGLNYRLIYRVGWEPAQIAALCDGTNDLAELEQAASRILNTDVATGGQFVKETLSFLEENILLNSASRRVKRFLFWVNPCRLFRIIRYYISYHLFGER